MGNISRSRGYSWENTLAKKLRSCGWSARRFAAANNFPDVVGTNVKYSMLVTVEGKSYSSDNIYIPVEEFHRCFEICEMFNLYDKRFAMFAFKFNRVNGKRKPRYYYGLLEHQVYINNNKMDVKISCNYNTGIKPDLINNITFDFFNLS